MIVEQLGVGCCLLVGFDLTKATPLADPAWLAQQLHEVL